MEIFENLTTYPKLIVALTGLLAVFIKIKETFSSTKRKQNIKLDLEIYELISDKLEFEKSEFKKVIKKRLGETLTNNENGLTNFLIGLVVFVGFGLWTVDIYQNNESFNGWLILTAFCSVTGFSMLFGDRKDNKSKDVFFKIGFYDRSNFWMGLIIMGFTAVLTPVLVLKIEGVSFWQFISGLFFLIGLRTVFKNIKRIN